MNDAQFGSWMKRMVIINKNVPFPQAGAIWWRAQLRRQLVARERVGRPIRIAEGAGGFLCWALAAYLWATINPGGIVFFLAISLAVIGGLRAIVLRQT